MAPGELRTARRAINCPIGGYRRSQRRGVGTFRLGRLVASRPRRRTMPCANPRSFRRSPAGNTVSVRSRRKQIAIGGWVQHVKGGKRGTEYTTAALADRFLNIHSLDYRPSFACRQSDGSRCPKRLFKRCGTGRRRLPRSSAPQRAASVGP
jgi:hypothetical protein